MADKPLKFRSDSGPNSQSIFMRERFILNVANLRYEFDLIAILTPLPPSKRADLIALPSAAAKRKGRGGR